PRRTGRAAGVRVKGRAALLFALRVGVVLGLAPRIRAAAPPAGASASARAVRSRRAAVTTADVALDEHEQGRVLFAHANDDVAPASSRSSARAVAAVAPVAAGSA